MITRKPFAAAAVAGSFALLLAACSNPPPPRPTPERTSPTPTAMVEAIRAAGVDDKSVVQIAPLRDPAVDGYLDRAHADENAGNYPAALSKIDAALKLSPDAPDILQFRAEVEILLRNDPAAEADARRSFLLGPKVGALCARNWQTILEIAQADHRAADVTTAREALAKCQKAGPVRM
ncbi:MAG: tetratricopeptide repeat protein [Rhodanobacteraceae bacterium]